MRIRLAGQVFHVSGQTHELEDLRRIPVRAWNPALTVWEVAKTKKNADYLWPWRDQASPEALAELQALREGTMAKGSLPPGYTYKTQPFPHQEDSLLRGLDKPAYAYLLEPGCVDGDTEVLTPGGWIRIADYVGGEIMEVGSDLHGEFRIPSQVIRQVTPGMQWYRLRHSRGLDQLVTSNHRVITISSFTQEMRDTEAEELHQQAQRYRSIIHWEIPSNIEYSGPGIAFSDADLRLIVAIFADGHFASGRRVTFRLRKERKQQRLLEIIRDSSVADTLKEYSVGAKYNGWRVLSIQVPAEWGIRSKVFDARFYRCTRHQLGIIAEEAVHWDGHVRESRKDSGPSFSSRSPGDADFIQFAWTVIGTTRVSRHTYIRKPRVIHGKYCYVGEVEHTVERTRGRAKVSLSRPRHIFPCETPLDPTEYCFKTSTGMFLARRGGNIFVTGNCGKTHVCINDMQIAYSRGEVLAALVIAPNSILSNWQEEVEKHSNVPMSLEVYDPSRKKAVAKWIKTPSTELKVLLMAVETFSSGEGRDFGEAFAKAQPTAIYLDESSRIKTHNSARTKALLKLSALCPRRRIATGTCITKGVQDAWAQFQFLDPKILNQNYYAFRNRFCVMGGFQAKQIVGNRDVDVFLDMVSPHSVVYRKEECLRLPERIFQVRKVAPSEEQVKLYEALRRDGYVEVEGGAVSFTNPLVRDLRLQQVAGGFVAIEEDLNRVSQEMSLDLNISMDVAEALIDRVRTVPVPGPNPKLTELLAILEEIPYKAIIWFRFKPELRMVAAKLREIYGTRSVVEFHGDVDSAGRTEARRRLQEDPACRFFLGQIATGGLGITLTEARLSIYYSNDWSLENRLQSLDRNYRIGTNNSPIYIDLISNLPHWVDAKVYRSLSEGRDYVVDLTEKMLTIPS